MRYALMLMVFLTFSPFLHAASIIWEVTVERDDPAIRDAFGALDVRSAYRGPDGRWRYLVEATQEELSFLRSLPVRIAPRVPLAEEPETPVVEYRDADGVLADIRALEERYAGRAKVYTIGTSFEGRDILAVRISAAPSKNLPDKNEILIVGMHHAREWIAVEVPLRLAEFVLEQYDHNPRIRAIVDDGELWIAPMLNEDGFRYTLSDDRNWRKNRRDNGDGSFGVDPNRNYDASWGGKGASTKTSSDVYCGTEPFSEGESAAVRDLIDPANGMVDDMLGFLDLHSYSQLILYPYGNTYEVSPREKELAAIADRMSAIIEGETGTYYEPGKSSSLYIATGGSSDWFHLAYEFRNTFIVEMRPTGNVLNGFELDAAQIPATARENVAAALYFIEATAQGTDDIDTDVNGDGVIDYFAGCGKGRCEMIGLSEEKEENDDDLAADADASYGTDESMVLTDADAPEPRRDGSGGCSLILL
ncbi:MAG TPA: M14 family metallopeptidase [bacterium]|nr:M14 family metallopeptidase [bacterium]